jgi:hypothetical protein
MLVRYDLLFSVTQHYLIVHSSVIQACSEPGLEELCSNVLSVSKPKSADTLQSNTMHSATSVSPGVKSSTAASERTNVSSFLSRRRLSML